MDTRERISGILDALKGVSEEEKTAVLKAAFEDRKQLAKIFESETFPERAAAKITAEVCDCEFAASGELCPHYSALNLIPESSAVRLNVLPLELSDGVLKAAVSNPFDTSVIDELKLISGRLKLYVTPKTELVSLIKLFYKFYSAVERPESKKAVKQETEISVIQAEEKNAAAEFINAILQKAIEYSASDVHFEPVGDMTRVRCRIDGTLFNLLNFDSELHSQIIARLKIAANMDIAEKRRPQDGRMFYRTANSMVDIRISTMPTIFGEKAVLRLLKQDLSSFELEKLGFEKQDIEILYKSIKLDSGLILIVGPTGSGKSTTLHALMKKLNSSKCNVISIEDPVEYTLQGINQVQVNDKIGLSFSNILRSVLRQDPDKIMVGEIRDTETAELAIRAALTGHLVLSTLHADNTVSAVNRLLDMGIQPYLLAASLKCVAAQRLVRRLCPSCMKEYNADAKTLELLKCKNGARIYRAEGCEHCRHTGSSGRTVIAEILPLDKNISGMITSGASAQAMLHYALERGMKTLHDALAAKILNAEVSADELYMFDSEK
ncbi:MAG: GspE/PulE family protein [Synergistaceae bacterium]|nr:GspE/PulE family protein [Synergistaceae bacterium]